MRFRWRALAGVVGLLAALGLLGVPSAMAENTALCSTDETTCAESLEHVHEETLSGAKARLLSSAINVECDALFLGDTLGGGAGNPLIVHGAFTYSNCNSGCTATEENGPAEIKVSREGSELAKVTGEGLVHVVCSGFINCRYTGEGLTGHGLGPLTSSEENGSVDLSEQTTKKESGIFCPSTAKLDITTTPLEPVYIAAIGGGGGPEKTSTSLTTSLKGGGKEGAKLTVSEGSKVKDTATLSGENASKAKGTVKYKIYKDKECKELVTNAGEGEVKEGKVPDSEEKELEAGKEYFWQAEYGGDELNEPSKSTCGGEVLTVKAKVTLATKLSGGGKEGEEITVAEGSKVKDTATLSGTNVSSATGTVDYSVYKDKECKELATEAGKGKVEGSKAASSEEKELEAGVVYYWQAKYLGDSLHEESTSTCNKEVESMKTKVTLSTKLSGGGKEGEEITVSEGTAIKDKAALSGTNVAKATGTVKYTVYSDNKCTGVVASAGEGGVEGTTVGGSEEKKLEAGATYYWQAEYGGDSLHEKSTSPCTEISTVKAATSISTLLLGHSPEGEELIKAEKITLIEGFGAADSATLSGTKSSTATGEVSFALYADSECKELIVEAGGSSVEESIAFSEEVEPEEGTYYWQATYEGDDLHQASTSTCGKEVLTVKAATSVSTMLSGGTESGELIVVEEETVVTDSATLSGPQSSTATGEVGYNVYADNECEELVAEAGEMSVSKGKALSSKAVTLEPGVYFWQAEYTGDAVNSPSTSPCGSEIEEVVPPPPPPPASVTLHKENQGGAALGNEAEVEGASGNLLLEAEGGAQISCSESKFVGKVGKEKGVTIIRMTSWEFKNGPVAGDKCTITQNGANATATISAPVEGTLMLLPNGTGELKDIQIQERLFIGGVLKRTCEFGTTPIGAKFTLNNVLGLKLETGALKEQQLLKINKLPACGMILSFKGVFAVTTKPPEPKQVVPTSP